MAEARFSDADTGDSEDETMVGRRYQDADVHIDHVKVKGISGGKVTNLTAIGVQNVHQHDQLEELKGKTLTEIKEWTKNTLPTSSVQTVIDKISSGSNWVTITGNPGEGKTTLGYMCLQKLEAENYIVFKLDTPDDYFTIARKQGHRCVIMMNDVLGAFAFDPSAWSRWQPVLNHILDKKNDNQKVIIIFVGRKNVLQGSKSSIGKYYKHIVNEDETINLSIVNKHGRDERLRLLDYYLDKAKITDIPLRSKQAVACGISPHGFPHCCFLYTEIRKRNPVFQDIEIFFSRPLDFLNETTTVLIAIPQHLLLFKEMLKGNGQIIVESVTDADERRDIKRACDEMKGCYIQSKSGRYVFSHPSIQESVAFCVGESDPLFAIQHYDVSYILQRVSFTSAEDSITDSEELSITINEEIIRHLRDRLAREFQHKNFNILLHTVFQRRNTCEELLRDIVHRDTVVNKVVSHFPRKKRLAININAKDKDGSTLLHAAYHNDDNSVLIEVMLELGADVNIPDSDGKTVFHKLCRDNPGAEILDLCIRHGADINKPNSRIFFGSQEETSDDEINVFEGLKRAISKKGKRPLHYLLYNTNPDLDSVKLLLKHGASVNVTDRIGRCPLQTAVDNVDLRQSEVFKILLKNGKTINQKDERGYPLFYHLVEREYEDDEENTFHIKFMLEFGADVNLFDKEGATVLHHVCYESNVNTEILNMLVKSGTDVNKSSGFHSCELLSSSEDDDYDASLKSSVKAVTRTFGKVANLLFKRKEGLTALHFLCQRSDISMDVIEFILENGACVNIATRHGMTALHFLLLSDNERGYVLNVSKLLIRYGSSVTKPDKDGYLPLHRVLDQYLDPEEEFLTLFANSTTINTVTEDITPIHYLFDSESEHLELALRLGADVDLPDGKGMAILHKHCASRHLDINFISLLLRYGANINKQITSGTENELGKTALHYLCQRADVGTEVLEAVLSEGASVNVKDGQGMTPLHYAVRNFHGRLTVVALLIDSGAVVNMVNNSGQTYIHLLCEQNNIYLITLQLLIHRGIDVNRRDSSGKRAIDYLSEEEEEARTVLQRSVVKF